ncbi:thiosulfate reductase cytochrome b subunit [Microbacterium marinum]|uniref:Thiosulfate reductase cytochrome b subunit n=1 Tax=Microbacterium marinum TaxID=421115 RepID=A0A7W7BNQ8_9MICO|nr:cytochrome b/b6 domain-containing protein [Microbacterium marinum]MBB4666027.1 thiosulfate reductase cytochrome b subunit [Microbacterium marinum]
MATNARTVRRGLPRASGGEPWPPADTDAPATDVASADAPVVAAAAPETAAVAGTAAAQGTAAGPGTRDAASDAGSAHGASPEGRVRRGLPREAGGEPWPPVSTVDAAASAPAVVAPAAPDAPAPSGAPASTTAPGHSATASAAGVRRGLPRAAGGEAWPPAGTTPASGRADAAESARAAAAPTDAAAPAAPESATPTSAAATAPTDATAPAPTDTPEPATPMSAAAAASPATTPERAAPAAAPEPATPATPAEPPAPLFERPMAHAGVARRPAPRPEPARIGPFTKLQWAGIVVLGGAALLYIAAMAVLAVRWLLSLEPLQDFLVTYPGEYHLPDSAPVGFPAWLNWSHFLNAFFMVLIIRTGLQVRSEKRPSAFWISKKNRKRKMSLTLWLHQALDILWLVNGVLFVVLLFATGQWMRVVPTSWEVFPNALSAALQYVSLDWPTENGWVNYNSLQQLAYFTTIFIAAPVAAITGYRMSALWPKQATKLNELYPVEWARKLHFPTMLYFVVFIAVHVALVLSTGALRNLNHMYAAQGSADPGAYAGNWTGFWLFALSLAVIVGAYVAMRPMVVAPIARLFGNVSGR